MDYTIENIISESLRKRRKLQVKKKKQVEGEVEEIVDKNGSFIVGDKDSDYASKQVTSNSTTDDVIHTANGAMGHDLWGGTQRTYRYWGEADMSKTLGFDDTMKKDQPYKKAKKHFVKNLGLPEKEAEEKMDSMGYDDELENGKVRLVENPKDYIKELIEKILKKRNKSRDLIKKDKVNDMLHDSIDGIVLKQIKALLKTAESKDIDKKELVSILNNIDEYE